jgi:predicted transcriptional regulator
MNYAEKKELIKNRIKLLKKEIHELEESLYLPNLPDVTRDETMTALSRLKKEQEDLAEEMNALLQFNHTRFVEAREETRGQMEHAEKELNLQTQLSKLQQELADANNNSDLNRANELISAISELQAEIKNLDRPDEDAFLEKFDGDTQDPFLER